MIAVIFEAKPSAGHKAEYRDAAAVLRPQLDKFDGFIRLSVLKASASRGKSSRYRSGATTKRCATGAISMRIGSYRPPDATMFLTITACVLRE